MGRGELVGKVDGRMRRRESLKRRMVEEGLVRELEVKSEEGSGVTVEPVIRASSTASKEESKGALSKTPSWAMFAQVMAVKR